MQKIVFLSTLVLFAISATKAQIKPDVDRSKIKRTAPAPAPPPASVNKTTESTAPVYSLTSVRVKIRTGNDNKEFPSQVYALLSTRSTYVGAWQPFSQKSLVNEMKINSDSEFGLEKQAESKEDTRLEGFQSSGVRFAIRYVPNFFADAWKIENISLLLEFKDQFGNLHPTFGSKTIVFSNAYGLLNNEYPIMECVTDGSFAPLTAVIKK